MSYEARSYRILVRGEAILRAVITTTLAMFLCGCGLDSEHSLTNKSPSGTLVQSAYALGSIKKGDRGRCAVCAVNYLKNSAETIVATADYHHRTYVFCSEQERFEFMTEPTKYALK